MWLVVYPQRTTACLRGRVPSTGTRRVTSGCFVCRCSVASFYRNQKLISDKIFFSCFRSVSVHGSPLTLSLNGRRWRHISIIVTAAKLDGHLVKAAFSPAPGRPASRYDWIVQKKPILIDSSLEIHTGGGTVCPLKTRIPDTFTKAAPCIQRCAPVVRRRSAIQGHTASFVPDTLICCEGMRGPAISSGSTRRDRNSSWSASGSAN